MTDAGKLSSPVILAAHGIEREPYRCGACDAYSIRYRTPTGVISPHRCRPGYKRLRKSNK